MITLAYDGTTLELSDRLLWTDEYAYTPVVVESRFGTTGALQLHVGKRQAGRPITLDGQSTNAWIERSLCDQLSAWAALPGAAFALLLRGTVRTVVLLEFQADPIWKLLDGEHTPELLYVPNFKFMEV